MKELSVKIELKVGEQDLEVIVWKEGEEYTSEVIKK